jgi:hypothetical protein
MTAINTSAILTAEDLQTLIDCLLQSQALMAPVSFSNDFVDGDEGNQNDEGDEAL